MEVAISAASWVLGKALGPVTDGLLEAWAASAGLGPNVDDLKMELLYAQGMLDNALGREIRSPALKELLLRLRQLAYNADNVLDELEYFRIQDELDGTYHAATDVHDMGCIRGLFLNARHTTRAAASKFKLSSSRGASRAHPGEHENDGKGGCLTGICSCGRRAKQGDATSFTPRSPTIQSDQNCGCWSKVTSSARNAAHTIGKRLPCCSFPCVCNNAHSGIECLSSCSACACPSKIKQNKHVLQPPKLKFDRVEISKRMKDIVEKLKPVSAKVSTILDMELSSAILRLQMLGSNRATIQKYGLDRPKTTPDIIEPKLYGRDDQKKCIIDRITLGEYFSDELVVLPIVGPGGIGKTTFTQHLYEEVKSYFEISIWICVSLNFNASRLAQEAVKKIPKVDGEKENSSDQELIEQRLKSKRFLLILDDMWSCQEEEWKKLSAPFRKAREKGNIIIVTTRIPEVAKLVMTVDCPIEMERLGEKDFMDFFEACVFGQQHSWKDHKGLHDVGKKILSKLKGFPLAAKTVGRLLRMQLSLDHWTRVLESKEWELQTNDNDIMPALKLSYDYLPFHLQQCFSYCALFAEDYEFCNDELIHLWIGLGILQSQDQNKILEDIGQSYLHDLVSYGFFKKNKNDNGTPYYVVHDLLHQLAVKVSSYECISISSSNVRSIQIPPSVRHLSIIIDDKDVENIMDFGNFKKELRALENRLNVESLHTLMFFGRHHRSFATIFAHLFGEATALRAIYLSGASYNVEDIFYRFSKLIHLRYIKIKSVYNKDICLPTALTKLYHLEVMDLQEWKGCFGSTRYTNNLVKLRHFLVPDDEIQLHSNIFEVGKLNSLQELRRFEVGIESGGFELSQVGQLTQLRGSLSIYGLGKIRATEEAEEAKLVQKKHLQELVLEWNVDRHNRDHAQEEQVLERLKPNSNLLKLCIRQHQGSVCPSWLGANLAVKNLESFRLDGVAWKKFPPIGELWLANEHNEEVASNISHKNFQNLRKLELVGLPQVKKWVGDAPCELFPLLEVLTIKDCSELMELSFSHSTCCQQHKEANINWFPRLRELKIEQCPNLLSFPPIPWTRAPCSVDIRGVGSACKQLTCKQDKSGYELEIEAKGGSDSTFWNMLSFQNLNELKELNMDSCPPLPLHHFLMLSSLKTLNICRLENAILLVEDESQVEYQFLMECLKISDCGASGKELTQLLTHFPKLSDLKVWSCNNIAALGVVGQHTTVPAPSSSCNKVDDGQMEQQQQYEGREEGEIATEGLLLLPSQLQALEINYCEELILHLNTHGDHSEAERTGGGGLQGLHSLRSLTICRCPKFFSSYSSSSSSRFLFPNSLEHLSLEGTVGMETLMPLSSLCSLTSLSIDNSWDLRGEGLWPLLAQGHLTKLSVFTTPNLFLGSEPSRLREKEHSSRSFRLQELEMDDAAGLLAAPICTLLSSSLTQLKFWGDEEVERFTKEQDEALQLLTSLQEIEFLFCEKLQCLPTGLHRLPNLKTLWIHGCQCIRSLPKDCLPSSLQKIVISSCPAIRSLPKVDNLPCSLRELDVCMGNNSDELRRQCRKLIGTIPIVRA
ncbi:hypothetical protein ACP70R_010359 [Stipagrostis hirtigluma subsp. patula]